MKRDYTKRDYTRKIIYWTDRLNESIVAQPSKGYRSRVTHALESLTFFVNRQLEIESKETR